MVKERIDSAAAPREQLFFRCTCHGLLRPDEAVRHRLGVGSGRTGRTPVDAPRRHGKRLDRTRHGSEARPSRGAPPRASAPAHRGADLRRHRNEHRAQRAYQRRHDSHIFISVTAHLVERVQQRPRHTRPQKRKERRGRRILRERAQHVRSRHHRGRPAVEQLLSDERH